MRVAEAVAGLALHWPASSHAQAAKCTAQPGGVTTVVASPAAAKTTTWSSPRSSPSAYDVPAAGVKATAAPDRMTTSVPARSVSGGSVQPSAISSVALATSCVTLPGMGSMSLTAAVAEYCPAASTAQPAKWNGAPVAGTRTVAVAPASRDTTTSPPPSSCPTV